MLKFDFKSYSFGLHLVYLEFETFEFGCICLHVDLEDFVPRSGRRVLPR